jgi:hypothetical protein
MKTLTRIIFSLGLVLKSPGVFAQAVDGYMDSSWPSNDRPAAQDSVDKTDQSQEAIPMQSGFVIKGKAVSVVPNGESLTIVDPLTKTLRMFRANKNDLISIKPGTNVRVTTMSDDPYRAQSIQEDSNGI